MCSEDRPSLSVTLENLRRPMPFGRKLRLLARNVASRVRGPRHDCCGHPGEPGC